MANAIPLVELVSDTVEDVIEDKSFAPDPYKQYAPVVKIQGGWSIHITDDVAEPSVYARVVDTLRQASENDEIILYVNTGGGHVDTADLLAQNIRLSKATVIGRGSGTVASAGTIILLACDVFEISPTAAFLFHEGVVGLGLSKPSDTRAYTTFTDKHAKEVFQKAYGNLLTEKEHASILKGTELWLSGQTIIERLIADGRIVV